MPSESEKAKVETGDVQGGPEGRTAAGGDDPLRSTTKSTEKAGGAAKSGPELKTGQCEVRYNGPHQKVAVGKGVGEVRKGKTFVVPEGEALRLGGTHRETADGPEVPDFEIVRRAEGANPMSLPPTVEEHAAARAKG